jgi:hypothetical protein
MFCFIREVLLTKFIHLRDGLRSSFANHVSFLSYLFFATLTYMFALVLLFLEVSCSCRSHDELALVLLL